MAGDSGSGGSSGSGGGTCATTGVGSLQDDFAGSSFSSLWEIQGDATARIVDGRARLELTPQKDSLVRLTTRGSYSLIACSLTIEFTQALDPGVDGQVSFALAKDSDNFLSFRVDSTILSFYAYEGGTSLANSSVDYDPALHRWLRLSEAEGQVVYQTSPDAQTWTTRLTHRTPSFVSSVGLDLDANTFSVVDAPGFAEFDNLNVLP